VHDERNGGTTLDSRFTGELKSAQKTALDALIAHDTGVLHAPPGFGKTVTAAAVVAKRRCSTLVIVHTTALLRQCHHAGAASHTRVLEAAHARFVLGLTATPKRRDGLEPVVFMNCGPVRHRVHDAERTSVDRTLERLEWAGVPDIPAEGLIQEVLSAVAVDVERTAMIAAAVVDSWRQGRKVLVLTERRGHINALVEQIRELSGDSFLEPYVLHGKLTSRTRRETVARLDALHADQPRCLVATAVVFAMPFAWRGTLQQYLGRVARASKGKRDIRVIDVHDTGHPMLDSMWRKRRKGYRALGWRDATKGQLF